MTKGFGAKVKHFRELRGMTQSDLSRLSGVGQSRISIIERASSTPSLKVAMVLAQTLEIPISDLISDAPLHAIHKNALASKINMLSSAGVKALTPLVDFMLGGTNEDS